MVSSCYASAIKQKNKFGKWTVKKFCDSEKESSWTMGTLE